MAPKQWSKKPARSYCDMLEGSFGFLTPGPARMPSVHHGGILTAVLLISCMPPHNDSTVYIRRTFDESQPSPP